MGTPQFALPTLQAIIDRSASSNSNHQLVGIYTKPPSQAGRGMKSSISPVHQLAERYCLPVYTPSTFKNEEAVEQFNHLYPDIVIVVAYGLILRKSILDTPCYGCLNLHPSALPRWRGAAPIEHTIMAGDRSTDICIMKMDEGMDTGPVILRKSIKLNEEMTASELREEASIIGAGMMMQSMDLVLSGQAIYQKQNGDGLIFAHKLNKEDERIEWSQSARLINCKIRALSPKPGAYFIYNDKMIKVLKADYVDEEKIMTRRMGGGGVVHPDSSCHPRVRPGEIIWDPNLICRSRINDMETKLCQGAPNKSNLIIGCGDGGLLLPKVVQKHDGKVMEIKAFLNGCDIMVGTVL